MIISNVVSWLRENIDIIISAIAMLVALFVASFNTRQSRIDSVFQIVKDIAEQRNRAHEAYLKYMNTEGEDTPEEYVYRERVSEYINSFELACEMYNKYALNRRLFNTLLKDELDNIHSREGLAFDLDQNDYLPENFTSIEKTFKKLQRKNMKEKFISIISEYKNHVIFVAIAAVVIMFAQIIGFKKWGSVAPDIYVGVITSAFVSILILIEEDRRNKKKNKLLREDLLLDVIDEIINYFGYFSFWVTSQCSEHTENLTFIEWSKIYVEDIKNGKYELNDQSEISSRTKNVCRKIDELISKKPLLYKDEVINKSDLENLNRIKNIFARNWFIDVSGEKFRYEHLRVFNTAIHNTLSEMPEYKWLVETRYGLGNLELIKILNARRTEVYKNLFQK